MTTYQMKEVYQIAEDDKGKKHWTRIGAAFVNRDGSMNAFLDVFPRTRSIHIRDPFQKKPPTKKGQRPEEEV